jgi:hypothetical protein
VLNELLGGVALGDLGLSGIVILVILMILTDRLVTRKRLEESREDGKGWRTSAETQQAINGELKAAVQELLTLARATHHALTSIQSLGKAYQDSTEEDTP